ncbi:MAG: SUMF1/EgtB/PvdO family nonheme iron enzyme [Fuerstiella sp.]
MLKWLRNQPRKGLTLRAFEKLSTEFHPGIAQIIAVGMAQAAYPNAEFGQHQWDHLNRAMPKPIVDWDTAGKYVHRCIDFGDFNVNRCITLLYGCSLDSFLAEVFNELDDEAGSEGDRPGTSAKQTPTGIPSNNEPEAPEESAAEQKRLAEEVERKRLAEKAEQKRLAEQKRKAEEEQERLAEEAERKRVAEEAEQKRKAEAEQKRLAEEAERTRVAEEAAQYRKAEEEQERLAEEAERKRVAPIVVLKQWTSARDSKKRHPESALPTLTSEPEAPDRILQVALVCFLLGAAVTSFFYVYVIMQNGKFEQGLPLYESGEVPNLVPDLVPDLVTNSIGMKLRLIPVGEFVMGSPSSEVGRDDNESQHHVRITKPYYVQTTEVTQGQWKSVMGTEPWKEKSFVKEGSDYAASYVSHSDAGEFCRKLSAREGVTYRLPTEAEWEYACRGGSTGMYSFGTSVGQLGQYAWFEDNAYDINQKYVHRVGQNRGNDFGLYDMHGNVFEWCSDWYDKDYYKSSSVNDPQGPSSGSDRVYRGGGWSRSADCCRSAHRYRYSPSDRTDSLGFRVARSSVRQ